jgi:glycosyltransferase 2 family protein
VGLLVWIAGQGGLAGVGQHLAGLSWGWFALALALYLVGQTACAWRWSVLAGSLGFRRPFRFFWVNYLGAMFTSLFLPSGLGGDVLRVAVLGRGGDKVRATVSVLADRGTGFLAMVWIGTAAAVLLPVARVLPPAILMVLYAAFGGLTLGFLAPFLFVKRGAAAPAGKGIMGAVFQCWEHPKALGLALAASVSFQVLCCALYMLLGRALSIGVAPEVYFLFCPIVSVAALSPLTIGALGERTAVLVVLMGLVGVDKHQAIALTLAWTGVNMLAALAGAVVLFFGDRQVVAREPSAPEA